MAVGFSKKPNLYIISLFHFVVLYSAVLNTHMSTGKKTQSRFILATLILSFFGFGLQDCYKGVYFGVAPWTTVG